MPIGAYQIILAQRIAPPPSLAIDGVASDMNVHGAISSFNLSTTTSFANDLLVAVVVFTNNTGITGSFGSSLSSSLSGDGLTWTLRTRRFMTQAGSPTVLDTMEVWTAPAPTATSRTTTFTTNGVMTGAVGWVVMFGIKNSNTGAPFDTNASASAFASNPTASNTTPSVTISTSNAADLLFAVTFGATAAGTAWPTPAGFTTIANDTLNNALNVSYQNVSAAQTSLVVAAATTGNEWMHYADAFK